jgi:hypothetical protein
MFRELRKVGLLSRYRSRAVPGVPENHQSNTQGFLLILFLMISLFTIRQGARAVESQYKLAYPHGKGQENTIEYWTRHVAAHAQGANTWVSLKAKIKERMDVIEESIRLTKRLVELCRHKSPEQCGQHNTP